MPTDYSGLAYPFASGRRFSPYQEPAQPPSHSTILGPLTRVTPPSGQVVTVEQAKQQAGITFGDLDALVSDKIDSATELAETEIPGHRQFLTATYEVAVRGWWSGPLGLPRPPLQSVVSVSYYATDGTLTAWPSTNYVVRTPWRGVGTVERGPRAVAPGLQGDHEYPVVIRFTCGYGLPAAVPAAARNAVLMIVAHSLRYRGDDDEDGKTSALEVPPAALNLLRSLEYGSYG